MNAYIKNTHVYICKCISILRCVRECYFVPCRLYQWCHKQGRNVWQKVANVSWANLSCSSLVKSNPAWLGPEELKIDGEKKGGGLLCIIYKYWYWQNTKWSPQMEIYAHGFMKGFRKFGLKARCMISCQGSSLLFGVLLYYHHHYLLSSLWNKHHKSLNSCYYKTAFILFYIYILFISCGILNPELLFCFSRVKLLRNATNKSTQVTEGKGLWLSASSLLKTC